MPDREWIYSSPSWNKKGVTLTDKRIEWWESGQSFAGGAWCEQSFEHYLANGPWIESVPADVIAELTEAVKAKVAATRSTPPTPSDG